jgi:hypothetical protein
MSGTSKREELIQKIADALHADDVKRGRVFVPRAEVDAETAAWYLDNACAAVNVFEQAHTPSDDEILYCPFHGDLLSAPRSYRCHNAPKGHEFRRTAVQEPSGARHICPAHPFGCPEPQGEPSDDELEALRGEAERVQRAAWAEIHGQDAGRKYSVAEVKRMVYSFDNVLSSLLRRTAVQEPSDARHAEHVTIEWAYEADCLEGECVHVDEDGEPDDLSACPTVPPFEVCVDCMDDKGVGRDPENWDDAPLTAWPCAVLLRAAGIGQEGKR